MKNLGMGEIRTKKSWNEDNWNWKILEWENLNEKILKWENLEWKQP